MLKNYIKTLILSTIMLVIGNNSNYCYGMEDNISNNIIKEKNEEINTNNMQNNNNINKQQSNINKDNNDDYKHLFDINYNKEHYDKICNECIKNVSDKKSEYKIFIEMVSKLFDEIIKDMNIDSKDYEEDIDFLKRQEIIMSDFLVKFSKVFDSISFVKNIKNNDLTQKLDNNNTFLISQLKQYEKETEEKINNSNMQQNEKTKRLNRLVKYRELSTIELLIYIQNNVRKLKAQTMKALEYSILNSYDNNITNTNNEKIIIETQQILEKVQTLYYNSAFNNFLQDSITKYGKYNKGKKVYLPYIIIENICKHFDRNVAHLDVLHYNGSKLQTRFNNLHNKVMATLDKMINDINNNRLDDRVVFILSEAYYSYSRFVENTDPNYIKTLFNDFKNTDITRRGKNWKLKNFLSKFMEKLQIVKELTDRKINQQVGKYHTLLDHYFKKDNFKHSISIWNYIRITSSVIQSLNIHNTDNNIRYKLLVQCDDFLTAFETYYNYPYLRDLCRWEYILKYNPGQSPQETFKAVLDNNNDSFDLDGYNVNDLELDIYDTQASIVFDIEDDEDDDN